MTTNVISHIFKCAICLFLFISRHFWFFLLFDLWLSGCPAVYVKFPNICECFKISPDIYVNFHPTVDIMDNWYGFRYHRWGRALLVFTSMDFPGLISIHILWRINTTAFNWNVLQIFDGSICSKVYFKHRFVIAIDKSILILFGWSVLLFY